MSWWDKTKEKANKTFITAHNAAFGPLITSKFLSEGVLTPEEVLRIIYLSIIFSQNLPDFAYHPVRKTGQQFVQAGDLLVYKCPTWKWF